MIIRELNKIELKELNYFKILAEYENIKDEFIYPFVIGKMGRTFPDLSNGFKIIESGSDFKGVGYVLIEYEPGQVKHKSRMDEPVYKYREPWNIREEKNKIHAFMDLI